MSAFWEPIIVLMRKEIFILQGLLCLINDSVRGNLFYKQRIEIFYGDA
jgi:hypothetical protein